MAGKGMVNMTLSVTRDERKALKRMAADRETTVSMLVRGWLAADATEDGKRDEEADGTE